MNVRRMLLVGIVAVVAIIAIALLVLLPYRPVIVEGNAPVEELVGDDAASEMQLHVFNTGWARMSWFLVGDARPWRGVPSYVIEHPEYGLIVYDPGMPESVVSEGSSAFGMPLSFLMEAWASEESLLIAQMIEANLSPDDVSLVIISHAHPDHYGQLEQFPNAHYISGSDTDELPTEWGLEDVWVVENFENSFASGPFDTVTNLSADASIQLVAGGGHTAEDIMLLLNMPSGTLLLAGDAIVHRDWLYSDDVQRIPTNPDRAADVRNQVRYFLDNQPGAAVFYGHDMDLANCNITGVLCHTDFFNLPADVTGT